VYTAELAPIPTATTPVPDAVFRTTVRDTFSARTALADAFARFGVSPQAAHNFANTTETVWTDFPEVGLSARIATV